MRVLCVHNGVDRVLTIASLVILAGCAGAPDTQQIDRFSFIGDSAPRVTSSDAFAGRFDNLGANESLVLARAADGGGALSQPTAATVLVVEPILEEHRSNPDLWLQRCDVDGDGVLDRHCPELFLALGEDELAARQFVSLQSWYTINANPRVDRDYWGTEQVLNTGEASERTMPVTLKLLTVNLGNKTFAGDMDVYVNIPPNVRLGEIQLASKVVNRGNAKGALNTGLMVLGAMAGVYVPANAADAFLDDYADVESSAVFETLEIGDDRARIRVTGIDLQPEEGVTVEYSALYDVVD